MSALFGRLFAFLRSSSAYRRYPGRAICVAACVLSLQFAAAGGVVHAASISVSASFPECHGSCAAESQPQYSGWMQFKGSGSVVWEWRMSPSYAWAKGGEPLFYRSIPMALTSILQISTYGIAKAANRFHTEWSEGPSLFPKPSLYDCDSANHFSLGVSPQAYYGVLGSMTSSRKRLLPPSHSRPSIRTLRRFPPARIRRGGPGTTRRRCSARAAGSSVRVPPVSGLAAILGQHVVPESGHRGYRFRLSEPESRRVAAPGLEHAAQHRRHVRQRLVVRL